MPGATPAQSHSCRAPYQTAAHGMSSLYLCTDGGDHEEGSARKTPAERTPNMVTSFAEMWGARGTKGRRRREVDCGGENTGFLRSHLSLRPVGSWAGHAATLSLSFLTSENEDNIPSHGACVSNSADDTQQEPASVFGVGPENTRFQLCGPHGLCHFSSAFVMHKEPQTTRTYKNRQHASSATRRGLLTQKPSAQPGRGQAHVVLRVTLMRPRSFWPVWVLPPIIEFHGL